MVIFMFKSYCSAQLNQVHRETWPYYMKIYNLDFFTLRVDKGFIHT